ncbi:hypothetical protein V6N13_029742 [Hibiscus sabdariffa]
MDKDKRKLVMVFGVAESFDNHESDLSFEWFMVVIYGYEMGPEKDEKALTKAVANQPVSILLLWMLVAKDFRFYLEGVFPGDCGSKLNHGVAVVGYGATLDGKELVG